MFPKPKSVLVPNTYAYESEPMVKATGFREYDARWLFGKEINLMGVQALGMGLGALIAELGVSQEIVTGHDFRGYSASIKYALISGLMAAGGQVVAVVAVPVALNGRSEWPVLVATKILDVGTVSAMAERAGGAVAISDGWRVLVAGTAGAASGADDLAALKQAVDLAAPGQITLGSESVAALPLSGGLRVLAGVADALRDQAEVKKGK